MRKKFFTRCSLPVVLVAVVVLVTVMGIAFSGCADVKSALTGAQQVLCNPTDEQKAEASSAAAFIQAGTNFAGPLIGQPEIALVNVQGTFNTLASGGCVFITDLQAALAYFDSLAAQVNTNGLKAKGLKNKTIPPPTLKALRAAV